MTAKTWAYEDFVEGGSFDLGVKQVSAAEIIEFASEFDAALSTDCEPLLPVAWILNVSEELDVRPVSDTFSRNASTNGVDSMNSVRISSWSWVTSVRCESLDCHVMVSTVLNFGVI